MTILSEELQTVSILIIVIALTQKSIELLETNFIYGVIGLLVSAGLLILRAYLQKKDYPIGGR